MNKVRRKTKQEMPYHPRSGSYKSIQAGGHRINMNIKVLRSHS